MPPTFWLGYDHIASVNTDIDYEVWSSTEINVKENEREGL